MKAATQVEFIEVYWWRINPVQWDNMPLPQYQY
jgi:hypothetical protein